MDNKKFAVGKRGLRLMLTGLAVIVAGYALLAGGGIEDAAVFNYDMFSFRRLVLAPVVMVCGIVLVIVAIMKRDDAEEKSGK